MTQTFDLILGGGEIVNHAGRGRADVGVAAGRIAAIGDLAQASAGERVDCRGLTVLPGVIDSQVHFREPGLEWKEDLETGSRGAVLGGVTAVFEMPNTEPATTTADALADKLRRAAGRMHCDHAFYVGGTHENAAVLGELERLPGCCGVKVFMGASTGSLLVPDDPGVADILRHVNRRAAFHSEDEFRLAERRPLARTGDWTSHPEVRDAETALRSTRRLVDIATRLGKRIHVLHVTTAEEIAFLEAHKDVASVETTPQHLTLAGPDAYEILKGFAQMNPPIRERVHQDALWAGIASGLVDVLGSDHSPHTREEKARPYPASPSGMPSVQTLLPIMLTHVADGRLTLERLVDLTSHGPQRLFGLADKGRMAAGFHADLTIVDLAAKRTITHAQMASRVGWTAFDGFQARGWPVMTVVRGRVVMREDEVVAPGLGAPVRFLETLGGMSLHVIPPDPAALGLRDPRYAPRRFQAERRADGALIIGHPGVVGAGVSTALDAVDRWAAATPAAPWLAERSGDGWRIVTYGEGRERIGALAGGLAALELGLEAPLLVLARNGVDHALLAFAAMSQRIPVAAVSPQYGLSGAVPERLAHAVRLLGPGAVLVDDARAFAEALESDLLTGLPVIATRHARPGDIPLERLLAAAPLASRARPDDVAKLLLTSGSTGPPKAVVCRHRGVAVTAAQVAACYDDPEPPVVVNQAPWSHSLGANAILQMVTHRGGTLYIDAGAPVAGRHLETVRNLEEIAPTYHNMVPAGWDLLAGELERNAALARRFFSRVRVLQYGGAALGQSACDRIEAVARATIGEGVSFASGYGATETGPTATSVHWPNLTMGLMGLPLPETEVKLVPMDGRFEFRVKGPQVCAGYWRDPAATARAFDEEGFYRLGDAARLADEGRLEMGLRFDGRLSENFKLASGVFVNAGALRVAAVSAIGGAAADAVVCGENRAGVGLLLFPSAASGGGPAIGDRVREGLERLNREAAGSQKVVRALILDDAPHAPSGEITDKGYINQTLARARRAADVERLFAEPPGPGVMAL